MNKKNTFSITNLILFLVCIGYYGCESLLDTYDEFIGNGETIYIGAPDTVYLDPGFNKLRFRIAMNADPKISRGVLSSLNEEIHHEFEVKRNKDGNDTISVVVEGHEGEYTFEVFLMDDQGNKSVRREVPGTIYGENYQSSLLTRRIIGVERQNQELWIEWGELFDGMIYTTLRYLNSSGEVREIEVSNDDKDIYLSDMGQEDELTIYSVYKPLPNAFEEFSSDPVIFQLPQEEIE